MPSSDTNNIKKCILTHMESDSILIRRDGWKHSRYVYTDPFWLIKMPKHSLCRHINTGDLMYASRLTYEMRRGISNAMEDLSRAANKLNT